MRRQEGVSQIRVHNPDGAHSIACGLDADLDVHVHGHVGYYVAGMNKHASVTVHGNAGPGAAENMMSGRVHVKGFASTAAGASAHGGLLVIDGDASLALRHLAEGRRHRGRRQRRQFLGVHGAGGADRHLRRRGRCARRFALRSGDLRARQSALARRGRALRAHGGQGPAPRSRACSPQAGLAHDPGEFKRVASAKSLYHWHADANQEY